MKIGIDIREALGAQSGKGVYTFQLVKELIKIGSEHSFVLYTDKLHKDAAVFMGSEIRLIKAHPLMWHFAVAKDWKKQAGDVFFAPTSFIIPAILPSKFKTIITVHDLIAFLDPQLHQTKAVLLEHLFLRRALRKAAIILTPSEHTKRDLISLFSMPDEKITVTPLAADEVFFNEHIDTKSTIEKYHLPEKFILTVSGLEPRKNISRLIDAFLEVKKFHPQLKLVIVGRKGWKSWTTQQQIRSHHADIFHIEKINVLELPAFYRSALAFVFPSMYEGFGLPPLEAMASGCPVVCSQSSSLPEVCGDAALYVDPKNTEDIKYALEKVLIDNDFRKKLKEKGLRQAQKFSWRTTAQITLTQILLLMRMY